MPLDPFAIARQKQCNEHARQAEKRAAAVFEQQRRREQQQQAENRAAAEAVTRREQMTAWANKRIAEIFAGRPAK